ncbi:MAG TPA: 16S rRNA (guanine(527)-N(7))-methyltransferase RsmG [Tepidisphaeraceae bacterium]|jgi:16S rRNA (guanine527-N7)-methyltransferase|nr:16S rRNA (guanine(527)-N(7))-methyltransferase RsmG [Tepidisphaeraceae bacterium]
MNELWNTLAAAGNVSLDLTQRQRLSKYLDLLMEANATMNLTRIVDRAAAEVQHVGDALTLLRHLPAGNIALADVGTGGGVPGIPLAIVRPDISVTLIESTKKKAVFLERAAAELGLSNVRVRAERAEDVGVSDLRETFDVAVARAVATLDWLAEWCMPLVKVNGKMLAMKGKRAAEELPAAARAIRLVGGGKPITHPVELPGADCLVIIEIPKLKRTDERYPRPPTQTRGRALA